MAKTIHLRQADALELRDGRVFILGRDGESMQWPEDVRALRIVFVGAADGNRIEPGMDAILQLTTTVRVEDEEDRLRKENETLRQTARELVEEIESARSKAIGMVRGV